MLVEQLVSGACLCCIMLISMASAQVMNDGHMQFLSDLYSYHLVVGAYVVAMREGLISEPWPLAGCVTSVSSPCYVDQSDQ